MAQTDPKSPLGAEVEIEAEEFADGDYAEIQPDHEEFDADIAVEAAAPATLPEIGMATDMGPMPDAEDFADGDYAEINPDHEEFDADVALREAAEE